MDPIQLEESTKAQHRELCQIGSALRTHARSRGRHARRGTTARRQRWVNDDTLRSLGVVKSTPLEFDDQAPCDFEPRFFTPSYKDEHLTHTFGAACPDYITGLAETGKKMEALWGEHFRRYDPDDEEWFAPDPEQCPKFRSVWFEHCLESMQQTDLDSQYDDGWCDTIISEEGDATFRMPGRDEMHWDYRCLWVMQPRDPARPHLAAVMGDSEVARGPEEVLASELHAAVELSKRQVSCGDFLAHHTRPVIIYTLTSETHGRITQAHCDAKTNKLVLRQSRVLDFQANVPTPDAYLLLRWMMNTPAGETAYTQDAGRELDGGRRRAPPLPGLVSAEAG